MDARVSRPFKKSANLFFVREIFTAFRAPVLIDFRIWNSELARAAAGLAEKASFG
jgi:hypothetical protein